jgi:3-hydroxybutyryl-CoA dehydrogenase
MAYRIVTSGESRSFGKADALIAGASHDGEVVIIVGNRVADGLAQLEGRERYAAVVVELATECLGLYTGEARGTEGSNVLGFSRFRLGEAAPSNLIELVRQPRTPDAAIAAAKAAFGSAGLKVAVCGDFAGRIVERLVRPYYNAALRRLDEGLASGDDMDTTLKLGLGYPEGPIALLERTGLAHHYDAAQALFAAYGDPAYAPARRARVAKQREER